MFLPLKASERGLRDGLLAGAGGKAHAAMHKVLDDFIAKTSDCSPTIVPL